MAGIVYRCPVCNKVVKDGELVTKKDGWVYHTACVFRSLRRPRLNVWLLETIRRKGRTTERELMREALLQGHWGLHFGILDYFLSDLERSGLIRRTGEEVAWAEEPAGERKLKVKPENVLV